MKYKVTFEEIATFEVEVEAANADEAGMKIADAAQVDGKVLVAVNERNILEAESAR